MVSGHGSKLPEKWHEALAALLEHSTIAEAAGAVGVHERTLRLWLREEPQFRAEYAALRKELLRETLHRLLAECGKAVQTLAELMGDGQQGPTRARAALGVLQLAVRGSEALDFAAQTEDMLAEYEQFISRRDEILGRLARLEELERRESAREARDEADMRAAAEWAEQRRREDAERTAAIRQREVDERERRGAVRDAKERDEEAELRSARARYDRPNPDVVIG
jgi:hypothetical protein